MNDHSIARKLFSFLLKGAFAACLFVLTDSCTGLDDYEIFAGIHGIVTDYETGAALENASVTLSPSGLTRQTDAEGRYSFSDLDVQQYTLTVQKSGYQPNRKTVTSVSGENLQVDIQLSPIPQQ